MIKNSLGKCKSEAERSESAIGVLRNALGSCKSEADKCDRGAQNEPEDTRDHPRVPRKRLAT